MTAIFMSHSVALHRALILPRAGTFPARLGGDLTLDPEVPLDRSNALQRVSDLLPILQVVFHLFAEFVQIAADLSEVSLDIRNLRDYGANPCAREQRARA